MDTYQTGICVVVQVSRQRHLLNVFMHQVAKTSGGQGAFMCAFWTWIQFIALQNGQNGTHYHILGMCAVCRQFWKVNNKCQHAK